MIHRTFRLVAFLSILTLSGVVAAQTKPPQDNSTSNHKAEVKTARVFLAALAGQWTGSYSLWTRPEAPVKKSKVTAIFQSLVNGEYFLMTYSWELGGELQEGAFLFGGDGKTATATWGDSFHMTPTPMVCKGKLENSGNKLILNGNYSADGGPAWGWRTEFTMQEPELLLMEAYNIMPNGTEALAVKAELRRRGKDDTRM